MDGPGFAFLHGGGQGGWVWDETIAAIRAQSGDGRTIRTVTLDVPGCGLKRARDTTGLDRAAIVAELADELDRSGLREIVLVGHSLAGTLLPSLAHARPDLIRRLVYVSCLAPAPHETTMNWRGSLPDAGSALETAAAPGERNRYRTLFCNDMVPERAERFLDRLGADHWPASFYPTTGWRYDGLDAFPSTYVVCLRDAVLPPAWQAIFAERFRAGSIVRIDAAHQAMITRPQGLAEILLTEAA